MLSLYFCCSCFVFQYGRTLGAIHQYTITKPVAIRWFTIFVAAEFGSGIVIFSLIRFATLGYNLVSVYSTKSNATESLRGTGARKWKLAKLETGIENPPRAPSSL